MREERFHILEIKKIEKFEENISIRLLISSKITTKNWNFYYLRRFGNFEINDNLMM